MSKKTRMAGWSDTFEQDLQEFVRTQDSDLFEKKLYEPLKYLIIWTIQTRNAHRFISHDDDEYIQTVMVALLRFMPAWLPNKGRSAVSWARVICHQALSHHIANLIKKEKVEVSLDAMCINDEDNEMENPLVLLEKQKFEEELNEAQSKEYVYTYKKLFCIFWRKYIHFYYPLNIGENVRNQKVLSEYLSILESTEHNYDDIEKKKEYSMAIANRLKLKPIIVMNVFKHFKYKNIGVKKYLDYIINKSKKIDVSAN